jgi:hypothetical protein
MRGHEVEVNDYIELGLTHSIHTSERKSFRACRRRWDWIFRNFYYPTETAKPLEFGVAYHVGMETYYDPQTWDFTKNPELQPVLVELAIAAFADVCEAQKQAYIKLNGGIDYDREEDYKERLELGRGMLHYHLGELAPQIDNFTPVKVEIPFEVPITNPDTGEQLWCKCNSCWIRQERYWQEHAETYALGRSRWKGLPVTYGGRIDALVEDQIGRLWIVDWKTAARLSTDNDVFLLLDDQISSYVWALRSLGLSVTGFIYHEQKKGFPQPPDILSRRYKGRLFSTNKQQTTTLELFIETVAENDPVGYEEGVYEEYIEFLRLSSEENAFYDRKQIHRGDRELYQIHRNIYLEALDMTNQELSIYPNPGRFGCNFCAFRAPCQGKNEQSDYQYTLDTMFERRKYHYWEDKKPSTEGKGGE